MASRDGITRRNLRRANDTNRPLSPPPLFAPKSRGTLVGKEKKGRIFRRWSKKVGAAGLEAGLNGKIVGNKLRFEHRLDV